jgi:hypothetical protein
MLYINRLLNNTNVNATITEGGDWILFINNNDLIRVILLSVLGKLV